MIGCQWDSDDNINVILKQTFGIPVHMQGFPSRDFPAVESQNNRAGRLIYRHKCKFFPKHNNLRAIAR